MGHLLISLARGKVSSRDARSYLFARIDSSKTARKPLLTDQCAAKNARSLNEENDLVTFINTVCDAPSMAAKVCVSLVTLG